MFKKYFTLIGLLLYFTTIYSQDTFSIIAVDPETGEIGSAGASCVDGITVFGGIILLNKIIPGRGGVNAQAWVCINPHINLDNAIEQMEAGLSPDEIISWLMENDACSAQNFNPEYRQYGIVDFDENGQPRSAAFTGTQADDYKGHLTGSNYAIQGNILSGPEILEQMEAGFLNTEGSLAEKLMAAMQGANVPGADSRCLDRGTSSTSAFLRVYHPDDAVDAPALQLSILEMPFGEEPIDSLQTLFDAWTTASAVKDQIESKIKLFPNPVKELLYIDLPKDFEGTTLQIMDTSGKVFTQTDANPQQYTYLSVKHLSPGVYFIKVTKNTKQTSILKFIKIP